MNWYLRYLTAGLFKKASITFVLEGSHKIAQPMDLLNLCSDFTNFIYYRGKLANDRFRPGMTDIEPDGSSDYSGPTGTINVYVKHNDEISEYPKAIKAWIADKAQEGYQIECNMQPEQSRSRHGQVFRVNIIKNPSTEYPRIPEINMSNANAYAMLRLLGLATGDSMEDCVGRIGLEDLKNRIKAVSQEQMQGEVQQSGWVAPGAEYDDVTGKVSQDPADGWKGNPALQDEPPQDGKAKMYIGGRDENYIDFRLQGLYELADYGLSNGFTQATWG